LTLNLALPHEAIEWVGAYFPLAPLNVARRLPFWQALRKVETA
jgi:hypothetical protein